MKQIKKLFLTVLILFGISGISPLLIPFATGEDGNINTCGYVAGIMFWAGLLMGIIGYVFLTIIWKRHYEKSTKCKRKKIPSILRFFSNPLAKVLDAVMLIGIAGVVISIVNSSVNSWIVVICLIMTLVGIYGHVLANGKIYDSILNYKKNE